MVSPVSKHDAALFSLAVLFVSLPLLSGACGSYTPPPSTEIPASFSSQDLLIDSSTAEFTDTGTARNNMAPSGVPPIATLSSSKDAPRVGRIVRSRSADISRLISQSRGKVVLFHIYASWCGPCRYEFPSIVKLERTFHSAGLRVIAVSLDDREEDLAAFLKKNPAGFDSHWVFLESDTAAAEFGSTLERYSLDFTGGIPFSAVFDRNGRLVTQWTGAQSEETYRQILLPLL